MNEDFVPFELAVKLKEKGFKKPCIAHYCCLDGNVLKFNITTDCIRGSNVKCLNGENNIYTDAPTISQVLKWLREEKKLHIEVMFIRPLRNRVKYYITDTDGSRGDFMDVADEHYETWEQATLAGIKYVLDNLI